MDLLHAFKTFIEKEKLFSANDTLLLAVSGGIDSVVLCELCHQAGYDFIIAHCNFQLRGEESTRDERFVTDLANKYNKPILVKQFETARYSADRKVSIQVAARELRYTWFQEILEGKFASETVVIPTVLLTAHHQDDNTETMLMNFFKGTGITGLRGILPKQGKIARPLLFTGKAELQQFATVSGLQWVEDSSNQSDKYTRNYLRNQLLPLLKKIYPEAEENMAANQQRFRDIEQLYKQAIEQHKKKLLEVRNNEVHIPVLKLQKLVPLHSVVYEIIKAYQFNADQVDAVIGLLQSETGRYIQSATHRIIKNRNWLIISPNQTTAAQHILIDEPGNVVYETGQLHAVLLAAVPAKIPVSADTACLDAALIKFPLLLRKWKQGDYFYPLGMRKKKKLSRFFIDQKLSATDKEKIWVLEMNKKIVWVIGRRIDDRFKITPATKAVLQLTSKVLDV